MIQLLLIFSVLYFYRHAANDELNFQHDYWQLGLYVGLSPNIPGAIRAAVLINKRHYHYDIRGKWWWWPRSYLPHNELQHRMPSGKA